MKKFVIFLVVINLGILAYFKQGALLGNHQFSAKSEIKPEKMHLLTDEQLTKMPLISAETTPDTMGEETVSAINATRCFNWGEFSSLNIKKAQSLLKKLAVKSQTSEKTTGGDSRYWVYLPPQKSAEIAQQKANEFKALGVTDLFVLQGDKWKNAISFGVFEDGKLAEKLLQTLKNKGIKNVVKKQRSNGKSTFTLELQDVTVDKVNKIREAESTFPDANLETKSCA